MDELQLSLSFISGVVAVCICFVTDTYNDSPKNEVSEKDKCNMNDSFDRYVV